MALRKALRNQGFFRYIASMINFQLQLYPTEWRCDVWIGEEREAIAKELSIKYGQSDMYWLNELMFLGTAISPVYDQKNDETMILLYLQDFKEKVIVHEVNHVVHHLGQIIGMNWTYDSQELQSIYHEWLFDEIMKRKP